MAARIMVNTLISRGGGRGVIGAQITVSTEALEKISSLDLRFLGVYRAIKKVIKLHMCKRYQ